ncbi:sugar porter family MFS transporter [Sporobolomyces salmoneus]|uniref:sugar porter family MFS transporter n=1 Tax=Sporobolomyces salmoneus TaxID=183962 RepID=UPI0031721E8E
MAPAVAKKLTFMGVFTAAFAAFGGFLFGYDTGYISGVKEMQYWVNKFGTEQPDGTYLLSSGDNSLVTSILSAGTFCGALLAFPAGDILGRRFGIIAFLCLFFIGVALQTAANNLATFAVGRVFAGLGVGGTSCLVPMYQAEVAPKAIRGAIVADKYTWMITIGLLVAAIVVNSTKNMNNASSYQIPIGLQFIWGAILVVGLVILPESPRWLLLKGRDEKARKALSRVLQADPDSQEVNEELAEIAANIHHERSLGNGGYIDCFRGGPGRNALRTWTGIGLQALQQLTGINFIFYYGTQFFKNSGISNPFVITIATNVVNVGATVPGMWAVDKLGRRPLLLYGAAGMAVSQLIVAIVGTAVPAGNQAAQKVLIAFVCIFIAHFAATWGPLAWVVTSEIYPTTTRGKQMSLSTASNWLLNFAIGYATPYLVDTTPGSAGLQSKVFFIWGGCCVLCFLFVFAVIPETKGLSLEQVDILYRNSSILHSNKFRKQIIAENMHDETRDAYNSVPKNTGTIDHKEKADVEHL